MKISSFLGLPLALCGALLVSSTAKAGGPACVTACVSRFSRFINPITDVCWSCLFPMTRAGLCAPHSIHLPSIYPDTNNPTMPDTNNPTMPISFCPKPPPIFMISFCPKPPPIFMQIGLNQIGLNIGYWEPYWLLGAVRADRRADRCDASCDASALLRPIAWSTANGMQLGMQLAGANQPAPISKNLAVQKLGGRTTARDSGSSENHRARFRFE
ncbi:TraU family protein (plasmid) [Vibrio splendidus]